MKKETQKDRQLNKEMKDWDNFTNKIDREIKNYRKKHPDIDISFGNGSGWIKVTNELEYALSLFRKP